MMYFTHLSNFRNSSIIRSVTEHAGIHGYGCAIMVLEILSEARTGRTGPFTLSLKDKRYDLNFWKRELFLKTKAETMLMLLTLGSCGVIDHEDLEQRGMVSAPILQDFLDESASRVKNKKSE